MGSFFHPGPNYVTSSGDLASIQTADWHLLLRYRDVDARARSAVKKFGSANLDMMKALAAQESGSPQEAQNWWNRSADGEMRDTIASLNPEQLSPHDAAALFWWMRNSMYFSQGLDKRDDAVLVSYQKLLACLIQSLA